MNLIGIIYHNVDLKNIMLLPKKTDGYNENNQSSIQKYKIISKILIIKTFSYTKFSQKVLVSLSKICR